MNIAVSLDSELVKTARVHSAAESRSVPRQIEYWARIGRIAEDNPDLTYHAIRGILLGLEDARLGNIKEYDPKSL